LPWNETNEKIISGSIPDRPAVHFFLDNQFNSYYNMIMSITEYQHNLIKSLEKELFNYIIPINFRVYKGIDLYTTAKEQIDLYNNNQLSLNDIFNNPDNELRNIIKLFPIDKKFFKSIDN
jgi:hypothetical protein